MLGAILGYTVTNAEVAELADAPALGAGGRKAVGVRVPSSANPYSKAQRIWQKPSFYWYFCLFEVSWDVTWCHDFESTGSNW
jgi:hypothetical protein